MKIFNTLLWLMVLVSCSSKDENPESDFNLLNAYNQSTVFVEQKLKSPNTADYPDADQKLKHIKHLGNWKYQIDSWVKSKNSLGLEVTQNFDLIVRFEGSNMYLESLTFN